MASLLNRSLEVVAMVVAVAVGQWLLLLLLFPSPYLLTSPCSHLHPPSQGGILIAKPFLHLVHTRCPAIIVSV